VNGRFSPPQELVPPNNNAPDLRGGDAKEGGLGGNCGGGGGISQRGKGAGRLDRRRQPSQGPPVPPARGGAGRAGMPPGEAWEVVVEVQPGRLPWEGGCAPHPAGKAGGKGCRLAVSCARFAAHGEHGGFS
jgi:hypothetical protein